MHPPRRLAPIALAVVAFAGGEAAAGAPPDYRIYTREAGLHRVTFEELRAAGLATEGVPSRLLGLENAGRIVPLHMRDGGDGIFGPGDAFEFAAEVLAGARTYYHPYARQNVYQLRWDEALARRLPTASARTPAANAPTSRLRRRVHLEEDRLLVRLAAPDVDGLDDPELWYWGKVTSHRDSTPFRVPLDLRDVDLGHPARLQVGMRGISSLPREQRAENVQEHQVSLMLGERELSRGHWSGKQPFALTRSNLTFAESPAEPALEISVTRRKIADAKVVDVVMIDFVELDYIHNGRIGSEGVKLHLPADHRGGGVELVPAVDGALVVAGVDLGRLELQARAGETVRLSVPPRERSLWVTYSDAVLSPVAVEEDRPSDLRAIDRQADYLVIAHASLLDATRELADLHRSTGLTVELIDVQDVYDEFGHGIVSPVAIREFVAHAYHNWRPPRPRFVLLVGDASWDTKNSTVDEANYANWVGQQLVRGDRFVAKDTEDYDQARRNDRNLIPSWNYHAFEGHAASDAYYVLVDGADELPDLALGRFPVASPEDVRAITAKIKDYVEVAPLGPWRNHVVWITGALEAHKLRTKNLANEMAGQGRTSTIILPGDTALPEDRELIIDAMDAGSLLTHFIGHGGRFIWRTGPPDLSDQVDLFGLEHLERLRDTSKLPVVLSVACYSAPFDHPSADSIGEAFLRLPDSGAVAFIGASWRNAPPTSLSRSLVTELSRPGTIGEALMYVKRQVNRPDVTHLYNLLGDPAIPVAAPRVPIEVTHHRSGTDLVVRFEVPAAAVGGHVSLGYLDAEGVPTRTDEVVAETTSLSVSSAVDANVRAVSVYFWNDETGVDGAGATVIEEVTEEATEETEPAAAHPARAVS
jgi:hypothetical protein